ncbi:MAG: site-specific DNA-methyltransferase [Burkholderiales bacterium]|nr:site-specific DNA-methyltransferase [Anaerolineae bacterium]
MKSGLPLDCIYHGDCIEVLAGLPEKSIDVVFADPPYNLQLQHDLYRPNMTKVDAVTDAWDQFPDLAAYDDFTRRWLTACRRVLKDTGTLWVIGSYHNIHRVGSIMMDLDYWILNEIIWERANPMPNFRGSRFNNAHETLIWAQKEQGKRYTFNYHAMKTGNDDKQMRSVWTLPICSGAERIQVNGAKAHSTQKPEALLARIINSSTHPGDIILDPFFGSGTTGAVAKRLRRHWIGIERDPAYITVAHERIDKVQPASQDEAVYQPSNKPKERRIPFAHLLEAGLLQPGQQLRFEGGEIYTTITADGALIYDDGQTVQRGSIHKIASTLLNAPGNGWTYWYFRDADGKWQMIDTLRQKLRG